MPRVRKALWAGLVLLASCALPPRVEDRSTPTGTYETFRGALARGEHGREWNCLGDGLRRRLGIRSRAEWDDARIFLDQGHIFVKGIVRSSAKGEPALEADGRVRLDLKFPLGYRGTLWLSRVYVLRAFEQGAENPFLYEQLDVLRATALPDGVLLEVPPSIMERYVARQLGPARKLARVELAEEWFLDEFRAGDETSETLRKDLDERN